MVLLSVKTDFNHCKYAAFLSFDIIYFVEVMGFPFIYLVAVTFLVPKLFSLTLLIVLVFCLAYNNNALFSFVIEDLLLANCFSLAFLWACFWIKLTNSFIEDNERLISYNLLVNSSILLNYKKKIYNL